VKNREFRLPGRIRNGDGKYAGIFVIHVAGIDAMIRRKGREPYALPVKEILGYCPRDPWTSGENAVYVIT
jgi:hypothetical protein